MRATLRRRNKVDIAFSYYLSLFRQPDNRPADSLLFSLLVADERVFRNAVVFRQVFKQIVFEAIFKIPGVRLAGVLVRKGNCQSWAQNGFGAQCML